MDERVPGKQRFEIPKPKSEISAFEEAIIGQDEAVESFARLLVVLRSGIRPIRPQPVDVKFLVGPSGVGKTEMVYRLAELLGGPEARNKVIKLNGGEYKSKAEVARLIGAPPGYIGSEDSRWPGGTKPILSQENLDAHRINFRDRNGRDTDIVIILVDEVEKADPAVHHAFLSIMDKGNLGMANNTSTDFREAVIFFTSNVGNQHVEQLRKIAQTETKDQPIPEVFREAIEDALVKQEAKEIVIEAFKMIFPPEFRGRIKDLVIFRNLNEEAVSKIIDLKVADLQKEFALNGVPLKIVLADSAKVWLVRNGCSPSEGARALEKLIQISLKDSFILAHANIGLANKTIYVELDEQAEELAFYFSENPDLPLQQEPQQALPAEGLTRGAEAQPHQQAVSQRTGDLREPPSVRAERKPSAPTGDQTTERQEKSSIPKIADSIKTTLVRQFQEHGLDGYVSERNKLTGFGLINVADANVQPEIQQIAIKELLSEAVNHGIYSYVIYRDLLAKAGVLDAQTMNSLEEIQSWARKELLRQYQSNGFSGFANFRGLLVSAGMGTVEKWNKLLK